MLKILGKKGLVERVRGSRAYRGRKIRPDFTGGYGYLYTLVQYAFDEGSENVSIDQHLNLLRAPTLNLILI